MTSDTHFIARPAFHRSTLLLAGVTGCMLLLVAGCQNHSDFASTETPSIETQASADTGNAVDRLVGQFVGDLQRTDYQGATNLMSPSLRSKMSPQKLQQTMKTTYQPYAGSADWQFDAAQSAAHGKMLIVRARFVGTDHGMYRTNFTFTKSGDSWLIDDVLAPSKPNSAKIAAGHMSVAPMQSGH